MGGDTHDPRDQVGVDPTGPATVTEGGDAVAEVPAVRAEPALQCERLTRPATDPRAVAGPPDLTHAIQAATDAFDRELRQRSLDAPDIIRIAVEAAAPVLLQATRDRLADLEETARNVLSCLHAGNVFTAESLLRHALDGPAAQEEDDQVCDACGGLFTHDPQCGYLADSYRDGTEGRQ